MTTSPVDGQLHLDDGFTMFIGANRTAIVFEVGVVQGDSTPVIVHAMRAREKFLR